MLLLATGQSRMFLATVSFAGCIQGFLVYISVTMWHVVTVSVE